MRVNIYAEEMTHDVRNVDAVSDGALYFGLRILLGSDPELSAERRSAVTFWFTSSGAREQFRFAIMGGEV